MVLPKIETEVKKFRKEIKDARRAAAAARRRAVLEEAGVVSMGEDTGSSSQQQLSASSVPKCIVMEGIEEEKGPTCLVCRDGFQSKPDEILGLYVFCKRVAVSARKTEEDTTNVATWSSGDYQLNFFYTTVTHLNAIHYSCHRESVRLDRSSSRPRDEWEGSALRNSQTKCNNLFPLEPPTIVVGALPNVQPSVTKTSRRGYSDAIDQYFFRNHALGNSGLTQLQLLLHDLGSSIFRFGAGDMTAFSRDTQGGGAHSNASLIPYFVQLGLHLESSHEDEVTSMSETLKVFLETGGDELAYYLSFSICFLSVEDWLEIAPAFLRHAQKELGTEKALSTIAFVHMVQRFFKQDLGEKWKLLFRQQLAKGVYFSEKVQELLQFYEGHKVYDNESFMKAIESAQTHPEERMGFLEALRSVL
uniref:E3 ubiquitin ligase UBR4 C-terminal domain-containing protein n=1 Tax=Rhodosorus marinus TaxID=101924 RepID=A0A7S0BFW7_9RHOD|mmetsp:Transcript_14853/g.21856  ORF Transcript_14853/g.21856 Transcript_14853/m.21856 type:complete len:417 (+) Transcript_14853:1-1251(+)